MKFCIIGLGTFGTHLARRVALGSQLQADRLWLLRQIDSGRWSEWRLDLAALERELGQLLEQVEQIN